MRKFKWLMVPSAAKEPRSIETDRQNVTIIFDELSLPFPPRGPVIINTI